MAKLTDHGSHATTKWTQSLDYAVNNTTETVEPQAYHLVCNGTALYVAGTTDTEPRTWDPATGKKAPNVMHAFVAKLTDAGTHATPGWQRTWIVSRDNYELVALMLQRSKLYVAANIRQSDSSILDNRTREEGVVTPHYHLQLTQLSDQGSSEHLDWTHTEVGQGRGLAVAGTSIYVVGREDAEKPFGLPSHPTDARTVPGDLFVAKLVVADTTVRPAWVQRIRGTVADKDAELSYVVVRGQHVYVAGVFSTPSLTVGAIVLKPKPFERVNSSETDFFVAQLTDTKTNASFDWVQRLGGAHYDHLRAFLLTDSQLYVSGFFDGDHGDPILLGKQQFLLPNDSGMIPEVLLQAWLPLSK